MLIAAVVTAVLAILLVTPGSSQAKEARLFAGSFGSASSIPTDPYPLSFEPGDVPGVAVNDVTHDVYVSDPGNHRVEEFGASGEFLLAFGADVGGPGGDVCGGLVPCSEGTPGSAPGQLTTPIDIAVDNSTGPSQGDLYVADENDNIVSKFDSAGNLISSWGKEGQLDGSTATHPIAGPFGSLRNLAVDPSGNLWVGGEAPVEQASGVVFESLRLFEYKQDSSFITDAGTKGIDSPSLAVDQEDNLYLAQIETIKFSASGEELGIINTFRIGHQEGVEASSVALDSANDDIYLGAATFDSGVPTFGIAVYEDCHVVGIRGCAPTEFFGADRLSKSNVQSLAVDPGPPTKVYAVDNITGEVVAFISATVPDVSTVPASSPTLTSATIKGTVSPDGVALNEGLEGCRFEWGETSAYGNVAPCDKTAAQIGSGSAPVEVHVNITGLIAGKTYHFRLVAGNASDVNVHLDEPSVGQDVVFGPALIDGESVANVSSTSATLEAQVDPQNVDTHVQFEYGTSTGYGQFTPSTGVGLVATDQDVSEHVQGLTPSTVYHYRVVASSVLGTVVGEDHVFTTQSAGTSLVLADARQWELVSPQDKHGATISVPGDLESMVASVSGEAFSSVASLPTEPIVPGYSGGIQIFATRGEGGGWSSRDISTPHSSATGISLGNGYEYRAFSEDLSTGLVEPQGSFTSLAPNVFPTDTERTPYIRHDTTCLSEPGTCYEPLATGAEGYADVPEGTAFGAEGGPVYTIQGAVEFVGGASPDLQHVVVGSSVQLTKTATHGKAELYEWSADKPAQERLELVSLDEANQPAGAPSVGFSNIIVGGAVSRDGSRVFWTEVHGGLYVWDAARGVSLRLDQTQTGASGAGSAEPEFQGASADGGRVFFTDQQALTADSGATNDKPDLYECDIVEEAGGLKCVLHDLTPSNGGEDASLVGPVTGFSKDGSWVYFVANGVLAGTEAEGARPGTCPIGGVPVAGKTCNLYVVHDGASGWAPAKLVAGLSDEDDPDWANGSTDLSNLTARVSDDGDWLVFMSNRSLTGYDNRDAVGGKPDEEAFLYHASAEGAGRLACASCRPTGARPVGVEFGSAIHDFGLVSKGQGWAPSAWLAASVPGLEQSNGLGGGVYQPRYLSNDGRVFFDSSDALVPQDVNHNQDVYESEPAGVGDCTTESSTYAAVTGGCVSLVSSGRAVGESVFIDASETGNDVFFVTGEKLTGNDTDNALDIYDAHLCTNSSPCASEAPSPPACTTADACRAAPEPQPAIFGAPASATFSGAGNIMPPGPVPVVKPKSVTRAQKLIRALNACHKDKNKHKRVVCERRAHKQYGAKQARTGKAVKKGKG